MAYMKETRRLLSSTQVKEELMGNSDCWIALECCDDDTRPEIHWRVVIACEGEDPIVVITTRGQYKALHSINAIRKYLQEFYPEINKVEVPLVHGDMLPKKKPAYS